ncbi:MAG TPA: septal ring lytic transglycosylase RlpA family protein [Balneolaceae bacterium]|nr:septal ring lytic transglycosylase RlpA family protein [Balneolaceae bacterium]
MTFTYHPYVSKAAILFLVILLVASCGVLPRKPSPDTLAMIGEGRASWYGPEFHGKRTANGETYNMNQLTAAHRTLPFNTRVRVDNLENGQSVIVRINDRGPYIGNRIIDLSREAATQLGMIRNGTANVRLYLLEEGDRPVTSQNSSSRETFTIQLASFDTRQEAETKSSQIIGSRVEVAPLRDRTVYRVYYGVYYNAEEALQSRNKLAEEGINGFVKQVEN